MLLKLSVNLVTHLAGGKRREVLREPPECQSVHPLPASFLHTLRAVTEERRNYGRLYVFRSIQDIHSHEELSYTCAQGCVCVRVRE